jgi:hypothetical protein
MALSFDLLTGLTVTGILAILSIYVIVVYKKGWLTRESKADQAYYLCPNPKCKRVFKKPVWLTDLARTPPESYQACPHCGVSIRVSGLPSHQIKPLSEALPKPIATSETRSRTDGLRPPKSEDYSARLEPFEELRDPHQVNTLETTAKHETSQTQKSSFQFPHIRKEKQESHAEPLGKSADKGSQTSSKKCSHFFGYVKTLPKNTPIPDECLWCPSIVDCLSHAAKVEAEA